MRLTLGLLLFSLPCFCFAHDDLYDAAKVKARTHAAAALQLSVKKPVVFWRTSYTDAAAESQRTGKPMLIDFRTQTCHYCDMLESGPMLDAAVQVALRDYVPVRLDAGQWPETVRTFGVTAYPTLMIRSPEGKTLRTSVGFVEATDLLRWIKGPQPPVLRKAS